MRRLLVLLVACVVLRLLCFAQSTTATITGRVLDPARAVITGASISATNVDTGIVRTTTTNDQGLFTVGNLLPGNYRIEVSRPGFRAIVKPGVLLHVQDVIALNFEMSVGSTSESITVEAGTPLINTEDASVSTVVDRNFVANTPLNGRSFQDLISMTPGVVTQNPNTSPSSFGAGGNGGDFSVNGQRTESNYYTVDGVSGNIAAGSGFGNLVGLRAASGSIPAGTALGTTQSLVSVDALQEFRVQSSTYSSEYGRSPGGQFSLVTRSGTNDFHGTVFDYLRNDFFDANDWFNNHLGKRISALRQNDFGGTLGGPLLIPRLYHGQNRTFFFVSYEGLRLVQPQAATTNQLVPDTFMRQQAPAALQPILNAFPLPNGKDFGTAAAPGLAQFVQPFSLPSNIDSTSLRLDHTFAPKLALFFRFAYTPSFNKARGQAGSASVLTTNSSNIQTYTLGALSQLSDTINNDFRLGYARSNAKQAAIIDSFGGATPINLATAVGAASAVGPFPQLQITVPGSGTTALSDNTGSSDRLRQWNLVDTFGILSGQHQLKFGLDYRRVISPASRANPQIFAIFTNAQQVLTNRAAIVSVSSAISATPIFNETAVFIQDQWRLTPVLNLSLGLRWEVDPPPHGADGKDAYTLTGTIENPSSLALAPRGTPLWHTSWYNFAPRIGFAWTVSDRSGWETVVRGGGGVFFDTNNQVAASGFSALGFNGSATYLNAALPVTATQLNVAPSIATPFNSNVFMFPSHLQLPYTLQWNLSVQQALGTAQAVTVSYVGAAGRRLTAQQTFFLGKYNPIFPAAASAGVVFARSGLTSDYHSLQLQFQRSIAKGIHALASYTWSHCIDVGSSYTAQPSSPTIAETAFLRGNCETDVRQNFQGGASWDTPAVRGSRLLHLLASNWGLDGRLIARTSFPVPLVGNQVNDPATGSQYRTGLNLLPNQPVYIHDSQYPGGRAVNPAAFALPAAGTLGNAPRNFVRGFGAWQINMAVRREFTIQERLHLQLRAEAFNVLNHPNFGRVDPTRSSATFGQATSMLNQQLGTVASQYQQGGPRSMQFALKLVF
jgi:hypothetical protein